MPTTTTVLYKSGGKFDMDYYKKTHMPLVEKAWAPHGLKSWKVLQFPADAPYCTQATLEWDSIEDFQKAQADAQSKVVLDDIKNFADPPTPIFLVGDVVLTS